MARPLRVEYPGALYHITARGNERRAIFSDDRDREMFLGTLADVVETNNLVCHAYCLMDNHYHLLVETPDANLSHAMRDLNGIYTQRFNKTHRRAGHLLQGRYKAFVVEKDTYLLEVARYIVLNPVRAKMVGHPRVWRWSSYRTNAGLIKTPDWLHVDLVLGMLAKRRNEAHKQYRQFVQDGVGADSPFDEVKEGVLLGSPQFVSWIWEKTHGSEEIKEIPRSERIVGRPTLKDLFAGTKDRQERDAAIIIANRRCGYLMTEIAEHLDMDPSTVGKIARGRYNQ